jgi:hypothetical protein
LRPLELNFFLDLPINYILLCLNRQLRCLGKNRLFSNISDFLSD